MATLLEGRDSSPREATALDTRRENGGRIAMKKDFETLAVIQSDGVVQLVLNRPSSRNAMTHEMKAELDAALDEAEIDSGVTAVVLRGEGPVFSAGHDLKQQFGGKPVPARPVPPPRPPVAPQPPTARCFRQPPIRPGASKF